MCCCVRIGVVGLGYWGSKHVRVLTSLGAVTQVVGIDPQEGRRTAMESAFPTLLTRPSLEAALPDVDAVIIATQPSTHGDLGVLALDAGKHVLVEKPLATTVFDSLRLMEAAERSGTTLMVGHTFEYNDAVLALRDLVAQGQLGDVLALDGARLNLGLYQSDCNVIWDLAPHDVSIINLLLGATPTAVTAWGSDDIHKGLVDNAYLRLDYDTVGAKATVHVSWLDPLKVRRLTVVGRDRMAVYDDLADEQRIRLYDKGVDPEQVGEPHQPPMTYRYGDIVSPYIQFREPLAQQAQHFIESATDGSRPRTDGASGLAVVRTLEAAQRSMVEGRTIVLEPMERLVRHDTGSQSFERLAGVGA